MAFIKRVCSAVLLVGVLILSVWFSRGPSSVLALLVAAHFALRPRLGDSRFAPDFALKSD